jgi:hypothetical protein
MQMSTTLQVQAVQTISPSCACGWCVAALLLIAVGCSREGNSTPLFDVAGALQVGEPAPSLLGLSMPDGGRFEPSADRAVLAICVLSHSGHATQLILPRLQDLYRRRAQDVDLLAIVVDAGSDLESFKREHELTFPCAADSEHACVLQLGASRTPTFYVFGKDRRLVYSGPFDDSTMVPDEVRQHLVEQAIDAVLQNQTPPASRPAIGLPVDDALAAASR